jgi:hypothetical protein
MSDDKARNALLDGPPEERIKEWLRLTKDDSGHFKSGVGLIRICILTCCLS